MQYNRSLYKGHRSRSQKFIYLLHVAPKEDIFYTKDKTAEIYNNVSNVSFIWRFHCMSMLLCTVSLPNTSYNHTHTVYSLIPPPDEESRWWLGVYLTISCDPLCALLYSVAQYSVYTCIALHLCSTSSVHVHCRGLDLRFYICFILYCI